MEQHFPIHIQRRMRRNRITPALRSLIEETTVHKKQLIQPIFITENNTEKITSMPGIFRFSLSDSLRYIEEGCKSGINAYALFCHIPFEKKDRSGSNALDENGLYASSIRTIKKTFPELLLIADVALDPFTDHGFDGLIDESGYVLNDPTVHLLAEMSFLAASSGADLIAPSDMMDGRIGYIRSFLDKKGYENTGIMSYAVKFASHLYAPFRTAVSSTLKKGDKKSFQVNGANANEAILECLLDEQEGADLLLIKPGLFSLDILCKLKSKTYLPIGAFQVSGEYSMIKAAAQSGFIDQDAIFLESLTAMRRAGADFIITYAAIECAKYL